MLSKTIFVCNRYFSFPLKVYGPYACNYAPWLCQTLFLLGCLGACLTLCFGEQQRILKLAEFGENYSLSKQPLHFRSYLLKLVLEHSITRVNEV